MAGFVKIAKSDEIQSGQGKMIEVDGKKIALFNVDGAFTPSTTPVPIAVGRFRKEISMENK